MKKSSLYFTGPREVEIKREKIGSPNSNEVLVKTEVSAISSGTEMLFYKNKIDEEVEIDKNIESLQKKTKYPFKYGYSSVGRTEETGKNVPKKWKNKRVFSFHPHESYFLSPIENLIPVPSGVTNREAIFFPSIETAINLLMDGRPLIGENVIIIGQGVIGLLVTSILSEFPLTRVFTTEKSSKKRKISENMGADRSLKENVSKEEFIVSTDLPEAGADLTYEVSGDPKALEQAIRLTRYSGKIVIGSWYGDKSFKTKLNTDFHRKRVDIISSQVSSINPIYSGRWNKSRRSSLAWNTMKKLNLKKLITHDFPLEKAQEAYSLIENNHEDTLQVIFTYE